MNHYTYKITNSLTREFYVGVRSTEKEVEKDPYMGSSSEWNKAYIKANKENLSKEIVDIFASRTEANKAESDLIEKVILEELCVNKYIPKYYKEYMRRFVTEETRKLQSLNNTKEGNPFFGKTHSDETRKKLSEARKVRVTKEETREKLREVMLGENNPFHGKKHTEETKKHLSKIRLGKYTGEDNAFYGRKHTEESKKLMSESMSGENNPNSKPVSCRNIETNEISIYPSITELSKLEDFSKRGVEKALRANRLYKKKYQIEYISKI